jgi:hypothetical protein
MHTIICPLSRAVESIFNFFLQNKAHSFAVLTQSMHLLKNKAERLVTKYPVPTALSKRTMYETVETF